MANMLGIRIPDTIDDLISMWEEESSDNSRQRLTLLHKNENAQYYFLSCDLSEVESGRNITYGTAIKISDNGKIQYYVHSNINFKKRDSGNGYYLLLNQKSEGCKVIPFMFMKDELPSVIITKTLQERLFNHLIDIENFKLEGFKRIGENGLFRYLMKNLFIKSEKEKRKSRQNEIKKIQRDLNSDISKLFETESSPSTLISKFDYDKNDRKKETLYTSKNNLYGVALILSLMPFLPSNLMIREILDCLSMKYKVNFGESESEERKRAVGDFLLGNPEIKDGVQKMMEGAKHFSNAYGYPALLTASVISASYALPSIIYYPLIVGTVASGVLSLCNLVTSKGRNSCGIIASALDSRFTKK